MCHSTKKRMFHCFCPHLNCHGAYSMHSADCHEDSVAGFLIDKRHEDLKKHDFVGKGF